MAEKIVDYRVDADVMYKRIMDACNSLKLKIVKQDSKLRRINASTGMSLFSWGEKINIFISKQADGCSVMISADPKLLINITAYGRGDSIVTALLKKIESTT